MLEARVVRPNLSCSYKLYGLSQRVFCVIQQIKLDTFRNSHCHLNDAQRRGLRQICSEAEKLPDSSALLYDNPAHLALILSSLVLLVFFPSKIAQIHREIDFVVGRTLTADLPFVDLTQPMMAASKLNWANRCRPLIMAHVVLTVAKLPPVGISEISQLQKRWNDRQEH
jgi:hypothetical protein